jgi:hypothetical protein
VGASPRLCAPVDAWDWVGGGLSQQRDESRRPADGKTFFGFAQDLWGGGAVQWQRRSGGCERRGRGQEASGRCGEARCGANWSRGGPGRGAPRRVGGGGGRQSSAVVLRLEFNGV